jgi:hypothetical protein
MFWLSTATQILVISVSDPNNEALEVERIFSDIVVGHEPLEQSEDAEPRIGNVEMAKEIEPDVTRPPVL